MVMGDGEGVGLVMTDANEFFISLRFFINLYCCEEFLMCFFKQLLAQNEFIFNL